MATKFLDPGGDTDFAVANAPGGFWSGNSGGVAVVTDFVHGAHVKSIKFRPNTADEVNTATGTIADAGARVSFWIYFAALPSTTAKFAYTHSSAVGVTHFLKISTGGILSITNFSGTVLGTGSTALTTGVWYRISFCYTAASTVSNETRLYLNGTLEITSTNGTLVGVSTDEMHFGNAGTDTTLDFRLSDIYIDDSNALTDPGHIWVTAKRPVANGTKVEFTTQVGAGGSGVGTGHSPQVNERPISSTNGWSIATTTKKTEEYTIQSASAGDIDISGKTIKDFMGWVYAKTTSGGTPTWNLVLAGVETTMPGGGLGTSSEIRSLFAGSTIYPAGGTDIGMTAQYASSRTATLQECGVVIAYIVPVTTTYTLTCAQGSYSLTGQALALYRKLTLAAVQGAYALTGQALHLQQKLRMLMAQGSYSLTGQAALLKKYWKIVLDQGAYSLTGNALTMYKAKVMTMVQGSYAVTGQALHMQQLLRMTLVQGSYALTGYAANLYKKYTLAAVQGAYALTGNALTMYRKLTLTAVQGSYALTGQALSMAKRITLALTTGYYNLTGFAASIGRRLTISLAQGSYTLTGQAVAIHKRIILSATTGYYTLTGFALKFPIFWHNIIKNVVSSVNVAKHSASASNAIKHAASWVNKPKSNI